MILVDHSQRTAVPLTPRQRRAMWSCAAIVAVAAVGVVVWLSTAGQSSYTQSRNGCVNVVVAGATGGQLLHRCGAAARAWCKTEYRRTDPVALSAQPQCRDAGIYPTRSATSRKS
jgi:hypothetical protein